MEIIDKYKSLKIITIVTSSIIFLVSLTQVAYTTDYNGSSSMSSSLAFSIGWMDVFGAGISWFATPLLIYSWIYLFKKIRFSLTTSFLSILFCCSFLFFDSIDANEGGTKSNIVSYGYGYWLWVLSCIVNCIGILIIVIKQETASRR